METVRLSDFVSEAARTLGVGSKAAAYEVGLFFKSLKEYYYVSDGPDVPQSICWLGSVASPDVSSRGHVIDFGMINNYFQNLSSFSGDDVPDFTCTIQNEFEVVPASAVYFSRENLKAWAHKAGVTGFGFLDDEAGGGEQALKNGPESIGTRQLNMIGHLTETLIGMLVEVNNAYSVDHDPDSPEAKRAEDIKKLASRIDQKKKLHNQHTALRNLAEKCNVGPFPSIKTFGQYAGKSGPDE